MTRSIRRKLVVGLMLVLLLLVSSTLTSISGVYSCSRMVNDLELSIANSPRRDELIASISALIQPLSVEFPNETKSYEDRARAAELQHQRFVQIFSNVQQRVQDFELKWQRLPARLAHPYQEQVPFTMLFSTVDERLGWIASGMDKLKDPDHRQRQVNSIIQTVAGLIEIVDRLPDPSNRLGERLQEARADYQWYFRLVTATGIMSVIVLISLILWGHQLIFSPLNRLHRGVKLIAEGDYSYRLNLETQCEIAELARAFNEMAARIQQDRRDKEREIEDRSRQLILSERLAGAGFLASGVAHEINNPLSVIITCVTGLQRELTDDALSNLDEQTRAEIHEYLKWIETEADRSAQITQKLLDFSHGQVQERNLYDVTAIAQEVVAMVSHLSRYQSRKLTLDQSTPVHAWVNAPEIKQVILNLIANALDATDDGGHVDVSLHEYPDVVEIVVRDDGCGMTTEQMENIFEPFFSTKDVGKGTGLGLSITHRIVVDHGGTLEVESSGPGQGSRFTLRLPKRQASSNAA